MIKNHQFATAPFLYKIYFFIKIYKFFMKKNKKILKINLKRLKKFLH